MTMSTKKMPPVHRDDDAQNESKPFPYVYIFFSKYNEMIK